MNGSEKQITWAESIKAELLPTLESALGIQLSTEDLGRRGGPGYSLELQETAKSAILSAINNQVAGDWIDWRNEPVRLVLISKYGNLYPENDIKITKTIQALINKAQG